MRATHVQQALAYGHSSCVEELDVAERCRPDGTVRDLDGLGRGLEEAFWPIWQCYGDRYSRDKYTLEPRRFAYISYADSTEAACARAAMDEQMFQSRTITVAFKEEDGNKSNEKRFMELRGR
ncbi:serine/arginine-rich splicing factor 2 [Striga asiatica]|uniref:Serine/arginine-rich splicing factor 2 n=1 Tax=Striga asiatica TaxID=4170 RepID=A0A5A7P2F8_STRAF|nr:serine/arginine-rich splicing factor 2 [Striga asiatica]